MSEFYQRYEIPAGSSGVATTVHVHYDGERRRALLERARRRPRWQTRDAVSELPERVEPARIRENAHRRVYGSRRDNEEVFHYDEAGWRERPHDRDRHADALKQFRDALRRFYRDQAGEGDEPLAEFLAWIRSHMDPGDWGKPRPDPNRIGTPSVLKYAWPAARPQPLGFKTSAGQGNSSQTMASGSSGFRDSVPRSAADLNALHRRYYSGRVL